MAGGVPLLFLGLQLGRRHGNTLMALNVDAAGTYIADGLAPPSTKDSSEIVPRCPLRAPPGPLASVCS